MCLGDLLAGFKGPTSNGWEEKGWGMGQGEGRGGKWDKVGKGRKGRGKEGREGEGREGTSAGSCLHPPTPDMKSWIKH